MTTTATPVRPVPVETVTPIRPSEAIRLGCLIAPVPLSGFWGQDNKACVNRALFLGMFGGDGDYSRYTKIDGLLPELVPPCGWDCMDGWALTDRGPSWVLIHLNDAPTHHWSRERIADWLAEQGL